MVFGQAHRVAGLELALALPAAPDLEARRVSSFTVTCYRRLRHLIWVYIFPGGPHYARAMPQLIIRADHTVRVFLLSQSTISGAPKWS
jgi:hypothetical protein